MRDARTWCSLGELTDRSRKKTVAACRQRRCCRIGVAATRTIIDGSTRSSTKARDSRWRRRDRRSRRGQLPVVGSETIPGSFKNRLPASSAAATSLSPGRFNVFFLYACLHSARDFRAGATKRPSGTSPLLKADVPDPSLPDQRAIVGCARQVAHCVSSKGLAATTVAKSVRFANRSSRRVCEAAQFTIDVGWFPRTGQSRSVTRLRCHRHDSADESSLTTSPG